METIWLQFNDEAMTLPCGWSNWQQPLETWPYQQEVPINDSRYVAYYDSMPPWTQPYAPVPIRG
jgi:hypothetical protein